MDGAAFFAVLITALLLWLVWSSTGPVQKTPDSAVETKAGLSQVDEDAYIQDVISTIKSFERVVDKHLKQSRWLGRDFRKRWFEKLAQLATGREILVRRLHEQGNLPPELTKYLEITSRGFTQYARDMNDLIIKAEKKHFREFFTGVDANKLTDEQQRAAINFEDRLQIVAAAGSGKTSVMVAKVGYAILRKFVAPEQVLMLAFNKDAASELRQRLDKNLPKFGIDTADITVSTFHAFGLAVIAEGVGKKPSIARWVADNREQEKSEEIVKSLSSNDQVFARTWAELRLIFRAEFSPFETEDRAEYWDFNAKKAGFRTLSDDVVKSDEERQIADWLYLHNIAFEYERDYSFDTATKDFRQYVPDFYFPDIDVYYEHFALDASGKPPPHFNGYLKGVTWKRRIHSENGTTLFETTSAEIRGPSPFARLQAMLESHGLEVKFDAEKPSVGRKPVDAKYLVRTLLAMKSHFKSNNLDLQKFAKAPLPPNVENAARHLKFKEVFVKFLEAWNAELEAAGAIDFDDMLQQSARWLANGVFKGKYKLILADEFQDTSVVRLEMLRELANRSKAHLAVVGDDWQSINRFAGADIGVITGFGSRFGEVERVDLTQTFRCSHSIASIASDFIMKNPQQLKKKVHGVDDVYPRPISVKVFAPAADEYQNMTSSRQLLVKSLRKLNSNTGNDERSVFILARYWWQLEKIQIDRSEFPNLKIEMSSIHGSKGREADMVIVFGAEKGQFPSRIEDDPVLDLVMPERDAMAFAEERRLFYVALTRAKQAVLVLSPTEAVSEFVEELSRDHGVAIEAESGSISAIEFCPECGGLLRERTAQKSGRKFIGCSRWPGCEYRKSIPISS